MRKKKIKENEMYFRQKARIRMASNPPKIDTFESIPTVQICQGIQLLIDELSKRQIKIVNWDDKNKFLYQLYMTGEKIFFLEDKNEK